ncbi:ParB N-terminal domain-containing protein [Spirosoma agri]|uniref:ParB N-terminal domain-containing protein n=1 Tax=Spirosoma agri TaxID=1987381 RepID=A0A6M0IJD5_9BACT|nr:ParB N-terminal domain-containing protein [Spirosoma agri]NEU67083.1 ParB N-terminal domain-containing protein [Spirosoma agri]
MIKLDWSTQQRKVVELLPYEYNPRKMTAQQSKKLRESLEKFGLVEIPVINFDRDGGPGILLAGHQRCKALIQLGRGDDLIDVRVPNRPLTDQEFKEYNIASNAIKGDWVDEILRDHFEDIDLADFGISLSEMEELHTQATGKEETPEMPIVAKFSEKYDAFVIVATNEIDANHLAELLQCEKEKSYKSETMGMTRVISAAKFIELWKASKS